MECYFHFNENAIGKCRRCNKDLCKACLAHSTNGVCSNCLSMEQIENLEYIKASKKRDLRVEFESYKRYFRNIIIAALIGFLIGLIVSLSIKFYGLTSIEVAAIYFGTILLTTYLAVSIYSGYVLIEGETMFIPDFSKFSWIHHSFEFINPAIELFIATISGLRYAIPLYFQRQKRFKELIDNEVF